MRDRLAIYLEIPNLADKRPRISGRICPPKCAIPVEYFDSTGLLCRNITINPSYGVLHGAQYHPFKQARYVSECPPIPPFAFQHFSTYKSLRTASCYIFFCFCR